ncbi:MAG: hypothetical protein ABIH52_02475 [Candidatus Aenigmatarchaeota archaeon]|nr:hypothetical protein [Nanoarchaeota archaeon]MBU1911192.1 hypothetical protein [Patescibacteria group bacterium]
MPKNLSIAIVVIIVIIIAVVAVVMWPGSPSGEFSAPSGCRYVNGGFDVMSIEKTPVPVCGYSPTNYDPFRKGSIYVPATITDTCQGSILLEYSCALNGTGYNVSVETTGNCTLGCTNGACTKRELVCPGGI